MTHCFRIAAVALLVTGTVEKVRADEGAAPAGNFSGSLVIDFDRDVTDAFVRADREINNGQTAVGLRLLQQLLDRPSDVLIEQGGTYVSLWEAANRRIAALPPAERETYERFVRIPSSDEFNSARSPLDQAALTRLTDRYRHSRAGREAALLLGSLAFDRGDRTQAANWGRWLKQHADPAALPERIRLWQQPVVQANDEPLSPITPETSSSWTFDFNIVDNALRAIDGGLAELDAQALTPILTCRPLIVDGRIVTRTLKGLLCVDAATGKVLWEQPIASHASRLAGGPGGVSDPIRTGQVAAVLLRRLVRDSLQDELSTDGRRVYTLITGDRISRDDPSQPVNCLRAVDIPTGVTDWEQGPRLQPSGPRRKKRTPPRDKPRFFLGPPLIDGDQLLLPAQREQTLELVSLDRQSGGVLWSVPLGQSVRDLWAREKPGMETPPEDRERQSTACRLSRAGTRVLCPTGAGGVICVDTFLRRIVWAFRYPRRDLVEKAPKAGDATYFREMPTRDAFVTAESWIETGVGVCLAPDADRLLAFEMTTGELLWSRPQGDLVQVMPGRQGDLLLIGEASVTAVGFRDGVPRWSTPTRRPVGRGIIHHEQVIVPIANGRYEIVRMSNGTLIGSDLNRGDGEQEIDGSISLAAYPPQGLRPITIGNLQSADDVIVCQSAASLERVSPAAATDRESNIPQETLASLLMPLMPWRSEAAPVLRVLRQIDSRITLGDGLLLSLLQRAGLRQSPEQQTLALLRRWQRAEAADDATTAASLRRQLTALGPARFYVTTSEGGLTCRLDRWLQERPLNLEPADEPQPRENLTPESNEPGDRTSPWPNTPPIVTEQKTNFGISYFQRVPVRAGDESVWRDVSVEVDRQARMVQFQDAAHDRPAVVMLPREVGAYRLEPRYLQGWASGHVLLIRIGTELIAFERSRPDELPTTSLWPAKAETLSLLGPHPPLPTSLREQPDETAADWDQTASGFEDVFSRRVADVGPVREDYFCHQQRGDLIAREMRSGRELWRRARLPVDTRSIGDKSAVVLFRESDPEVTVLDAHDGRTLRMWDLQQLLGEASVTSNSPFVPQLVNQSFAAIARSSDGSLQLSVIDMAAGALLWQQTFPTGTLTFEVDQTRLGLALPATEQRPFSIKLLDWQTGAQAAVYDVPGPDELREVWTFADAARRYVIVSGRITDLPLQNVRQIQGGINRPIVNGWLHAFDADATRLLWSEPLENVAFPLVQPRHVPLLIVNDMTQPAQAQIPLGRLICLDAHTGQTLASLDQPTHIYYALESDPKAARIDIRMRGRTLQLDYNKKPSPP